MDRGKYIRVAAAVLVMLLLTMTVANARSVDQKRHEVRELRDEILDKLYELQPSARANIAGAAGYAVFRISDVKLVVFGGGRGKGMAVNNGTGNEVFMKAATAAVGLGLGIKKFDTVFVFGSEKALAEFGTKGWDFGGQATAAVTDGVSGGSLQGAVTVAPDVWLYQMTDKGLEVAVTLRGIRYYQDRELN